MTIYQESLFTRDEIAAARPNVVALAGYPFAHCLSIREGLGGLLVADYSDLYAMRYYERPRLPGVLLVLRDVFINRNN